MRVGFTPLADKVRFELKKKKGIMQNIINDKIHSF